MIGGAYPIATAIPVPIYPAGAGSALVLVNTGNAPIYVDNVASGVGGFPITPGNRVTWRARQPLYAYTSEGTGSTLQALPGASDVAAMSVIGTTDDAAANTTLIASIDSPGTLSGMGTTSGYSSLIVRVSSTGSALGQGTVTVRQYGDLAGTILVAEDAYAFPCNSTGAPYALIRVPVLSPYVQLEIDASAPPVSTWTVRAYGRQDSYQTHSYYQPGLQGEGALTRHAFLAELALPNNNSLIWYPGTWAGQANLNVEITYAGSGASQSVGVYVADYDIQTVHGAAIADTFVANYTFDIQFYAPRKPLVIIIDNVTGVTQDIYVSLTYLPEG